MGGEENLGISYLFAVCSSQRSTRATAVSAVLANAVKYLDTGKHGVVNVAELARVWI